MAPGDTIVPSAKAGAAPLHLDPKKPFWICFGQAPSLSPSLGVDAAIQLLHWGEGKTVPQVLLKDTAQQRDMAGSRTQRNAPWKGP